MTTLTVLQMGLTAASLFGPKGADLGDLIRGQTELLLAVSQKIDTIMAAIKVLEGRLQDLTKLVGALPNETVKALKVVEIYGASNRLFLEMLPGYELDKKSDGILKANALWGPKVKAEILPGLSSARSQLMTFESPFGVPAVCSALLAERAAMAFVGASIGETETIRLVYRQYLEKHRQICTTAREQLQRSQATIWTQLAQVATEKRICVRQDASKGSSVDGCYRGSYVVQLADYLVQSPLPHDASLLEQPQYKQLADAGYLKLEDLPPSPSIREWARSQVQESTVRIAVGCMPGYEISEPVSMAELRKLAGDKYGNNIGRTLVESGRVCPTPASVPSGSAYEQMMADYVDGFQRYCFYSSMQYASEQALVSLVT